MEIENLFCHNLCELNLISTDKYKVLNVLGEKLYQHKRINNLSDFISCVEQREKLGSTYIGNHIAIPHYQSNTIQNSSIIIGRTNNLIDWDPINSIKIQYIVLVIISMEMIQNDKTTAILLSKIIELLTIPYFLNHFFLKKNGTEILQLFKHHIS